MDLPKLVPQTVETTSGSSTDDRTQGNTPNTPRVPETSPSEEKVESVSMSEVYSREERCDEQNKQLLKGGHVLNSTIFIP